MQDPRKIKDFEKILEDRVIISPNGIEVSNKPGQPSQPGQPSKPGQPGQLEKHTEEIQEIITKVPTWIVRYGITLLFIIILAMLSISILVPYPEIVRSPLKLQSTGNTVSVGADTSGRITKVFIGKNMAVKKGQLLIEIRKDIDQKTYILKAPNEGTVGFSAIVQPGNIAVQNQELLKIHPLNEQFFGVMYIRKNEINKIKVGQDVIIKLTGTTSQVNNSMRGKVDFVADEPIKDHFFVKVLFDNSDVARSVKMKNWMEFEAQIVIQKSNLFKKIFGNILKAYDYM